MDREKINYFIDHYSRMSDEDLSLLVVTRGGHLSEEAQHALQTVIQGRDQKSFTSEIDAASSDVRAQEQQARVEAGKRDYIAHQTRTLLHYISATMVLAGLFLALVIKDDSGWWLAVAGVGMFVYVELKRLLRRFLIALFRPN